MADNFGELIKKAKNNDHLSLGRALTWIEREGVKALDEKALLEVQPKAFRIGITGPPGAGKSTMVGRLIADFRAQNLKVGVMAVDPSSPFTRGAILGDRIRYSEHFADEQVFIRSLGSRGSLGGLSASAYLMLRAFDLCDFDVVLIETVGVGQTELEVVSVADQVCVVLVPESGDSVQAMKAGLLEIADIFVVNKGDRPGADSLMRELESLAHLIPEGSLPKEVRVFKTIANQGDGMKELFAEFLSQFKSKSFVKRQNSVERLRGEARALLRAECDRRIEHGLAQVSDDQSFLKLLKSF